MRSQHLPAVIQAAKQHHAVVPTDVESSGAPLVAVPEPPAATQDVSVSSTTSSAAQEPERVNVPFSRLAQLNKTEWPYAGGGAGVVLQAAVSGTTITRHHQPSLASLVVHCKAWPIPCDGIAHGTQQQRSPPPPCTTLPGTTAFD